MQQDDVTIELTPTNTQRSVQESAPVPNQYREPRCFRDGITCRHTESAISVYSMIVFMVIGIVIMGYGLSLDKYEDTSYGNFQTCTCQFHPKNAEIIINKEPHLYYDTWACSYNATLMIPPPSPAKDRRGHSEEELLGLIDQLGEKECYLNLNRKIKTKYGQNYYQIVIDPNHKLKLRYKKSTTLYLIISLSVWFASYVVFGIFFITISNCIRKRQRRREQEN